VDGEESIGEVLVSSDDLQRRVSELASEVSSDYANRDLLLVAILKGAVPFLADLMKELSIPRGWSGSSRTSTRQSPAATC
jgi:hypoxanthine phosphoribosyltransferase